MNKFILLVFVALLVGCATTGDPLLVRGQQIRSAAYETFKIYTKFEKENREALWKVNKGFKHAADDIRENGINALEGFTKALDSYKAFRDEKSKGELFAQIQLITAMISQANDAYLNGKAVLK